jgi:hypothetical protein
VAVAYEQGIEPASRAARARSTSHLAACRTSSTMKEVRREAPTRMASTYLVVHAAYRQVDRGSGRPGSPCRTP